MNIFKFIIKRLIEAIPVLIMVSILSFFIIRLSPSDPLSEMRLNPAISQETINYEIICGISPRVPRMIIKNGAI